MNTQPVARWGVAAMLAIAVATSGFAQGRRQQTDSRMSVIDESTISRTLHFAGSGSDRLVDVRTINGFIHVTGGDGADVQFEVRKLIRAETEADLLDAQRNVRLDIAERTPRIEAIVRDPRNQVCGEPSHNRRDWERPRYEVRFDFTVRVPPGTRLRLCTVNGGDVRVDGTSGDFEVDNVNGHITMEDIRGSGSAQTVNGPVQVSFTENPATASIFKTVNGNVVVTFQGGLSADLKMKTFNGGLFTDFDVQTLPDVPGDMTRLPNGGFVYRANRFTNVRVGGGGPELTFETLNGNVRALRAR
jgi:hypothetical protein